MTENSDDDELSVEEEEDFNEEDDLKLYLREIGQLEEDFSDLEDLDELELQEMREAINEVRQSELSIVDDKDLEVPEQESLELDQGESVSEEFQQEIQLPEELDLEETLEIETEKASIIEDFSDIGKMSLEELREMKLAIEEVKKEGLETDKAKPVKPAVAIDEIEAKIKQELMAKKEKKKDSVMTYDKFLEYVQDKRDKIWYHAIWYLTFESEDHIASKTLLYDLLKEATSKSPIDPIPEHQFYFGLGYILRLTLNEKQIIRYMSGGKFKININVKKLKELLEEAGEPVSTRPQIPEETKQKMFSDFLKDDFSDI
ncbi:MAG: hypothetical protein JW891_14575 [Candidatus Lokiarchaeota archaeon]|nr:hypothetical protein [Candidatus Lokiarchaeota archaeon]